MKKFFIFPLLLTMIIACSEKPAVLPELGSWKGELNLGEEKLPFIFEVRTQDTGYVFSLANGDEEIAGGTIVEIGDSLRMDVPVFDTWFIVRVDESRGSMSGFWHNPVENEVIPFSAKHGTSIRFETANSPGFNITGKWEAGFYNADSKGEFKVSKALGIFEQSGSRVTGTFLTPTGDYRFLEGVVDGRDVKLSTFDGAHAYLLKGRMDHDRLEGDFWSGSGSHKKWVAERNESFTLPGADTLTQLVPDVPVNFSFPNTEGKAVSLDDEKYKGKVVIVQVMGSWCPNCMDETAYLTELHKQKKSEGLEVIALAFEATDDTSTATRTIKKLKNHYGAEYDFLIAGKADKKEASEKLPFLSSVKSFPTTIFIDRKGKVARIHTGYNGPATGYYHRTFKEETEALLTKLL